MIDINTLFIALPVGNVLNSEFYLEQLPWLQAFSCGATRRIAGLSKISDYGKYYGKYYGDDAKRKEK
ncbi:MAG: hypothetical protein LKE85_11660 [Lachnospiraceae bacterium]|nr:hypothetical protein [Lachnospiraceae bacterium]